VGIAERYDGFLVDLDGTVWVGPEVVAGAPEVVRRLREAGKEVVFVTNDSRTSSEELAERLRAAGIAATAPDVLTAGTVTAQLAAESAPPGAGAFVIGAPALHREVAAAGLRVLDGEAGREAAVVLVALHPDFSYAELRTASAALQSGAALFATNREPGLPMPDGVWPGTGAILAAVEYASGATATIGGKPEPHLFERARRMLGKAARVAVVGDGLGSDIAGGAAAGLDTVLVLSGNASAEQAAGASPGPDHVLDSIAELN
jgi:HAD superfamily hydrolase (TIGR01450 family)